MYYCIKLKDSILVTMFLVHIRINIISIITHVGLQLFTHFSEFIVIKMYDMYTLYFNNVGHGKAMVDESLKCIIWIPYSAAIVVTMY